MPHRAALADPAVEVFERLALLSFGGALEFQGFAGVIHWALFWRIGVVARG